MNGRAQSGQALLVSLVLLMPLVLATLWVFNAGQVVNDKLRLQNAADAAASAAATWEARALNYQAYLNRGIVANEVAIAQLVSLRSWSTYMGHTLQNSALVTSWVPYLGEAMFRLAQGWQQFDQGIQASLPAVETSLSAWNNEVLATAQAVAHQQALVGAADLVKTIAQRTEPRAEVAGSTRLFQARNAATWQTGLTTRYRRGGSELTRFKALLHESRDGFTADRRANLLQGVPLVDLTKRGGTDLIGEYAWRGMDTLSLHIDLLLGSREVPIGWGAAENRRLPLRTRGVHGGSWRDNPRASRLATTMLLPRSGYQGIPEIRDVIRPAQRRDLSIDYSVELRLPQALTQTVDRIPVTAQLEGLDGQTHSTAPLAVDGALHAISTARVLFRRPAERGDRRREWPSLFSPYWQARLVAVEGSTRALAAPLKGIAVDPYAVLP